MIYVTLYLSLYSAITTSLLGIATFYFARREYRRSGPVVSAKLVKGHFLEMAPFVALAFVDKLIAPFVVPLLPGAKIRPPSRQFSVMGVYVQNTGRAPVTVRAIAAKTELTVSKQFIAKVNAFKTRPTDYGDNTATQYTTILGTYLTADSPPKRLEPHEGEFWCVSIMDLCGYYSVSDMRVSFSVTFDDGKVRDSETFQISSEEARHMHETYLAMAESGEPEPEIVGSNGKFGRLGFVALPATEHPNPYLEYRIMQRVRQLFSSSIF